jgi:hypothetical protein
MSRGLQSFEEFFYGPLALRTHDDPIQMALPDHVVVDPSEQLFPEPFLN